MADPVPVAKLSPGRLARPIMLLPLVKAWPLIVSEGQSHRIAVGGRPTATRPLKITHAVIGSTKHHVPYKTTTVAIVMRKDIALTFPVVCRILAVPVTTSKVTLRAAVLSRQQLRR